MIENQTPVLAARVDVLLHAVATIVKLSGEADQFEKALKANMEHWEGSLLPTRIKEEYLAELDGQMRWLLSMIQR